MKKTKKKLALGAESIRALSESALRGVAGGLPFPTDECTWTFRGTACISNSGQCDTYCICSFDGCGTRLTTHC